MSFRAVHNALPGIVMETGHPGSYNFYEKFISAQKCVLLDTTCDILHLAIQDTSLFANFLHPDIFVTGLYLDNDTRVWQYIVEVDLL